MLRIDSEDEIFNPAGIDRGKSMRNAWRNDLDVARSKLPALGVLNRTVAAHPRSDGFRDRRTARAVDHRARDLRAGTLEHVVDLGDLFVTQRISERACRPRHNSNRDVVLAHVL